MTEAFVYNEPAVPLSKLRFLVEENREAALHWRSLSNHETANMWHRSADEIAMLAEQAEVDSKAARVQRPDPQEAEALSRALPAPGSDGNSWRYGYDLATKHTRERIYNRVARLKPPLITSVEKTAIDKALAEIEKDADDTVTGPGFPS